MSKRSKFTPKMIDFGALPAGVVIKQRRDFSRRRLCIEIVFADKSFTTSMRPGQDPDAIKAGILESIHRIEADRIVTIDGDPCPHCHSRNTERVDILHQEDDFTIHIEQCGGCGKTFEFMTEAG